MTIPARVKHDIIYQKNTLRNSKKKHSLEGEDPVNEVPSLIHQDVLVRKNLEGEDPGAKNIKKVLTVINPRDFPNELIAQERRNTVNRCLIH